jgi:hypothetical protein
MIGRVRRLISLILLALALAAGCGGDGSGGGSGERLHVVAAAPSVERLGLAVGEVVVASFKATATRLVPLG